MTAEWRPYWVVYPSVVWRYYGSCTTMHEFSDSSWRVLAVGRAESFPYLPDIRSQSTNMTQLAPAKGVLKSATESRTSTNRTSQEFRSPRPFSCLNLELLYTFWFSTIIRNTLNVLKHGAGERRSGPVGSIALKMRYYTKVKAERNMTIKQRKANGLVTSGVATAF